MATDDDVFNKLSRIIAVQDDNEGLDEQLDRIVDAFELTNDLGRTRGEKEKTNAVTGAGGSPPVLLPDRPTPFEVWNAKQETKASRIHVKDNSKHRLNAHQMHAMIHNLHQSNRIKHDETVRVQNEGLRQELEGFEFKPRINSTSKELAATMKPIAERMPEMVAEKQRMLSRKRSDRDAEEMATCAFAPTRMGAKMSDRYLRKMGRSAKARPEDFFAYQEEKMRRNDQRRAIIDNIEARELIFKPQLPASSRRMHQTMMANPANKTIYDPISRTTTVVRSPRKIARRDSNGELTTEMDTTDFSAHRHGASGSHSSDDLLVEGPPLLLESDHPYKHNLDEYTSVAVPGAVSYRIVFDEQSSTEPVYDYVRFLKYDDQAVVLGAGKYTGGMLDPKGVKSNQAKVARTTHNWPGVGHRQPLIIQAEKFVVHFKTNGKINDWGFRMSIIPTISSSATELNDPRFTSDSFRPTISSKGGNYGKTTEKVHERLYKHAMTMRTDAQNRQAKLFKEKLSNVGIKSWEHIRESTGKEAGSWVSKSRTHVGKNFLGPALNDLLILDEDFKGVTMAECATHVEASIWHMLRHAKPLKGSHIGPETELSEMDFSRLKLSDF